MTPLLPALAWSIFAEGILLDWKPTGVPWPLVLLARVGILAGALGTTKRWWRAP